jgi:hypothetical protein
MVAEYYIRTDMTRSVVAFHTFANAPKEPVFREKQSMLILISVNVKHRNEFCVRKTSIFKYSTWRYIH